MRASDSDRDRVADRLREAAAEGRLSLTELDERIDALYAAKTYGELDQVVEDLPGVASGSGVSPPAVTAERRPTGRRPTGRVGGRAGSRVSKAVFSGLQRRGRWVVPERYSVKVVFAGAELDLREAQLEADEVEIDVKAVFGGVAITVPDDVYVTVDVAGVFGGANDAASLQQPPDGAPVLRITGKAVFGGVDVRRKPATS
nr:DUF1707 domain-containing protein [Phytoactinopolyspora alkaliphila]